jgi:ABC-type nickel/cobalt efflux system permease component RcnA
MSITKKLIVMCIALLALPLAAALAHPMGNFSISHYTALRVERDELRIRYRIDIAEIPTFQAMAVLDANGDKAVSAAERDAYLSRQVNELTRGQMLLINGRQTDLTVVASDLQVRPGAGDLPTLLVTIDYRVRLGQLSDRNVVEYADNNFPERTGWREIIAAGSVHRPLLDSDVPSYDRSTELSAYPTDAALAPPQVSRARFTFGFSIADFRLPISTATQPDNPQSAIRNPQSANPQSAIRNRQSPGTPRDRFTELIATEKLSLSVWLFSLLAAFVLGSVHAMSPGHGKTVVAAYLVGSRGTAKHAFLLGAVVTLTHTAGVFLLGLVALFASKYILPEQLYPWLGFASGMTIVGIGVWQFVKRYRRLRNHSHADDRDHAHNHGHDHHHGHDDHHHHGHSHHIDKITLGNLIALGVSGGLVPCPSALVVLLGAITLNRIGFGLILIVAFSLGLASVLIGIGLLMLYARRFVERFHWEGGLIRRLPLFSSLVITVLGFVIAMQALVNGGIVSLDFSAIHLESNAALLGALGLGFVLGLKHALDADHVVAVSTIVSEHRSLARSSLVGTFWGIGHTASLLIVGLVVIGLRLTVPERVALSLEFGVALMLIVLGVDLLRKSLRFDVHAHTHTHEDDHHAHLHVHLPGSHHHQGHHLLKDARRPLLIGMVHGLAGSAALMLLVLTTIPSPMLGLAYIGLFGVGSIIGMLMMSSVVGLPFVWTAQRFGRLNRGIKVTAGVFSTAFGIFLAWQIGFVEGLFR